MSISSQEKLKMLKKAKKNLDLIRRKGGYINDMLGDINGRINHYGRLAREEKKKLKKVGYNP